MLGTADDAVLTITSGADGRYEAPYLPAGDFLVTVVSLPTALAPTFDEDSGTTAADGITAVSLATGETHRTADFGYVAATGVGDRLIERMDSVGAKVIVFGPYESGKSTEGLTDPRQLTKIPASFNGYIWIEDIRAVGPALRPRQR